METSSNHNAAQCTACAPGLAGASVARLNSQCFCASLPEGSLRRAVQEELAAPEVFALLEERCPHLFSAQPVFVASSQRERMANVVRAIETVIATPSYRAVVLAQAPAIAQHSQGHVKGVFYGYDVQLHGDQLGLIEINTNAGGAMLNAILARAQHACCEVMDDIVHDRATAQRFENEIVAMFRQEWHFAQEVLTPGRELRTIAIVDEAPEQQYLYPEFLLFQKLFEQHGIHALIAAPEDLQWREGSLWLGNEQIDLVYNRLTDFYLESPACAALRDAFLNNAVVLTPHPQAHALFADKRNLAILGDAQRLQELGVPRDLQNILLANIPACEIVQPEHAERLWAQRKQLFFKPNAGYGGRAAYRGDKITKRVWEEILAGDYIAQSIVLPGERISGTPESPAQLKFDLRNYTYDGKVQWITARTYQGQTTNFRTPGGGFAPVYSIEDQDLIANQTKLDAMLA